MSRKDVRKAIIAYNIPLLTGPIEVFLFQSNIIERNVFLASILITFLGDLGLLTQSFSFIVDHVKNVKRARIILITLASIFNLIPAIVLTFQLTLFTFFLIIISLIGICFVVTYERILLYLSFKVKLDKQEYITFSQLRKIGMVSGIVLESLLSYLTAIYGIIVISITFISVSIYYFIFNYLTINLPIGGRLKESGLKLSKKAFSIYYNLLKTNRRIFYVGFLGLFIVVLLSGPSVYFYGLFKNSSNLYELSALFTISTAIAYVISALVLRHVMNKLNSLSKYFSFLFLYIIFFVNIALICVFHISPLLFFLGLILTRIVCSIDSSYEGLIYYSDVPSEIQGYATSVRSWIVFGMRLFTSIVVAGYVIQYYSTLMSVSIVIGVATPILLILSLKTRNIITQ